MRILLIDDDESVLDLMEKGLRPTGHELVMADSGELGLTRAAAAPPDLVIVDLRMPGLDGLEVTRRLKETAAPGSFLPVVLITAMDEISDRVRGFAAGCDDYLRKPVNPLELRARVHSLLARRAQHLELRANAERLRELQRLKEELAAMLVHDLRNPLTALRGNVEFLEGELAGASDFVREAVSDCRQLANRALALVGGLLDVAQLEEGILRVNPAQVVVAEFLPRCARFHEADIAHRDVRVDLDVEPADLCASFDADLVARVVENLLDNAVRYTPVGGRVRLAARAEGPHVVLTVGNSGPPIPTGERERIFDKFYRIDDRRAGARANRGLGLYFCKLAAEAHGGAIAVEETPELPTCFVVHLPIGARG